MLNFAEILHNKVFSIREEQDYKLTFYIESRRRCVRLLPHNFILSIMFYLDYYFYGPFITFKTTFDLLLTTKEYIFNYR